MDMVAMNRRLLQTELRWMYAELAVIGILVRAVATALRLLAQVFALLATINAHAHAPAPPAQNSTAHPAPAAPTAQERAATTLAFTVTADALMIASDAVRIEEGYLLGAARFVLGYSSLLTEVWDLADKVLYRLDGRMLIRLLPRAGGFAARVPGKTDAALTR